MGLRYCKNGLNQRLNTKMDKLLKIYINEFAEAKDQSKKQWLELIHAFLTVLLCVRAVQPVHQLIKTHGFGKEPALRKLHAVFTQVICLLLGFNPLSNHL